MASWRSWASFRTGFVMAGAAFVIASLATACLDYAGEELFDQCDTPAAPLPGSGSGSGSHAGSSSGSSGAADNAAEQPDCGAPTHAPGSGSGSGS